MLNRSKGRSGQEDGDVDVVVVVLRLLVGNGKVPLSLSMAYCSLMIAQPQCEGRKGGEDLIMRTVTGSTWPWKVHSLIFCKSDSISCLLQLVMGLRTRLQVGWPGIPLFSSRLLQTKTL